MKKAGFSLLEVLIALMIFAMTAVVMGAAYLNVLMSYQQAGRGNAEELETAFARQELMTQPDLQTAEAGDQYTTADGRSVKWTADIEPTTTADLFTVTLTCAITSPGQGDTKNINQTFMLLRPTWSDPTSRSNLRQQAASRIAKAQNRQAP